MKKLIILLFFFPFALHGQKTNVRQVVTGNLLSSYRGQSQLEPSFLSKTIYKADHYVSTDGNDSWAGTFEEPWKSWYKAVTTASRGDTVYIRGGEYGIWGARTAATTIAYAYQHDGTPTEPICIFNYPGEIPVINCDTTGGVVSNGFFLQECKNWRLKGLTIKNSLQEEVPDAGPAYGFKFWDCDSIYMENCVATQVQGEGFHAMQYEDLIGYYYLENCDSYNNYDPYTTIPGNNSNGFDYFNLTSDCVIYFKDCRSWDNGDDGFDTYGSDALVTFDGCWGFSNGHNGMANGFKIGPGTTPNAAVSKIVRNCIAATNGVAGITTNTSDVMGVELYNNTVYLNQYGILAWWGTPPRTFKNNVSYANTINNGIQGVVGDVFWNSDDLASYGITINAAQFVTLDTLELYKPRKIITYIDGSEEWVLPEINFMKLAQTSELIDLGMDVGLPYHGNRPDMGAWESTKTIQIIKEFYTATADGLTTGIIHPMTQNITVTSASANNICCLPAASASTVGTIITGTVGANGFELRVDATQAGTVYINNVTTNVEAAIPANTNFRVTQIDATHWVLEATTNLGAVVTAIIPDAV